MNGGGWGCIYNNKPLSSCCPLSANYGRSALLARTVRPCTSTTEIITVSNNSYIICYKCIKCVIGCQIKQPRTVRSCTRDGPRGCHNSFSPNLAPSGFFGFQPVDGLCLRTNNTSLVPDDVLLSFGQSVVEMWVLHSSCQRLMRCHTGESCRAESKVLLIMRMP